MSPKPFLLLRFFTEVACTFLTCIYTFPFYLSFFQQRTDKWWRNDLSICSEHTIRNSDITVPPSLLKCLWHGWWRGLALDKLAGFLSPFQMNQRNPTLTFQFTEIGRKLWRNLTQRNLNSLKKMACWLVLWTHFILTFLICVVCTCRTN